MEAVRRLVKSVADGNRFDLELRSITGRLRIVDFSVLYPEGSDMPHGRFTRMGLVAWLGACGGAGGVAYGDVELYKVESEFIARVAQLGLVVVEEGFESPVWDGTRTTIIDPMFLPDVLSQGVLWEPAAKDVFGSQYSDREHGLSTTPNWARTGGWGLYENHAGEPYPTTIRVSAAEPIFAVGGWINTNPDGQSAGFLFEDRVAANEPGYVLAGYGAMYPGDNPSFGHEFVGIIDPAGFGAVVITGTLEVNEKGILEGGIIYGCDDFSIGVMPGFGGCGNAADLAPPSGVLDLADINAFVAAFTGGQPAGDLDQNGVFDLADINAFVAAFVAGCP
jgi:hypothetical protein